MKYLLLIMIPLSFLLSFVSSSYSSESSEDTELSEEQVQAKESLGKGALLLDVRRPGEFSSGAAEGAINIPHDQVAGKLGELQEYKERGVVVYCAVGGRAGKAKLALESAGFTNVINIGGLKEANSITCSDC